MQVPDEALGWLALGWLRGGIMLAQFPIMLHHDTPIREVYNDEGDVVAFEFITKSGLVFRVQVTYEGQLEEEEAVGEQQQH